MVYCCLHRVVCVGGDGMFAELLNGILVMHNSRLGVDVHSANSRLRQPLLRIGIIPAGITLIANYHSHSVMYRLMDLLH